MRVGGAGGGVPAGARTGSGGSPEGLCSTRRPAYSMNSVPGGE